MARKYQCGFELNSITDDMEITTNSAPVSIGTTNVRSGVYAGRVNAGVGFWRQVIFTSNQTIIGYNCVAVYIVSPPNNDTELVRFSTIGNVSVGTIRLKNGGQLYLSKSDGSQIGVDSLALSLNTWYVIELKNDASTNPGTLEGRINGAVFASGLNSNQGSWARALVGNITASQTTNDVWFDDWIVNDSTGGSEISYAYPQKLIILRPDAAGDSNGFLVQIGGTAGSANNFTRVNEIPPDDATSYNGSTVLNSEDLFNCGASGLNSYDTVQNVSVGMRMADLVGVDATASFKVEIEKTSGGTKAQSATIIPNSTAWLTNAAAIPRNYPINLYQDPDGASWSQTTLDTMQIGYIQDATNVQTIAISNIWAYISYTTGTPPATGSNFLSLLGVS